MSLFEVVVPRDGQAANIKRGSGIVAYGNTIDYEGNLYGACNLARYEDRIQNAADRAKSKYPTVARSVYMPQHFIRVGLVNLSGERCKVMFKCPAEETDYNTACMWLFNEVVDRSAFAARCQELK